MPPQAVRSPADAACRLADGSRPQRLEAHAASPTWAQFEAIGLGPRRALPKGRAANLVVSGYRLLGFAVLGVIVIVLVGYVATTAFFWCNHTWLVPAVVSPTDEHVLALETELTTHQTQRDLVAAELDDAERAVAAEQRFERELHAAIKADLAGRRAALTRLQALASNAATTRRDVHATTRAFAAQQRRQLAGEAAAGLVDRDGVVDGRYQLGQIASSNLTLAERQAELDTKVAELATAVAGLGALVGEGTAAGPQSYDVLTIKRAYDTSKLALAKARDTRDMLAASLRRHDLLIASLEQSAYLRALHDQASVAVVPYDNVASVAPGVSLYACRASMLLCRRVGSVLALLPGEVSVRHPHGERTLRGRMVELKLDEPDAARSDVLFARGAPLWL